MRDNSGKFIAGVLTAALALTLACGGSDDGSSSAPAPSSSNQTSKPEPKSPPATPEPEVELSPEELAKRGRGIYLANCIACHNQNPRSPGAIGPDLAGSSLELLRAKVLRNEYPPGYQPKRESRAMIPLPYVEKDLPAIAAFLTAAGED